jgi:hypothetical protein
MSEGPSARKQRRWVVWLVDEARRGQLGRESVAEHFSEASLVVVKPLFTLIIDGADVHDYVASVEDSWVSGTLHVCYTASV